MTAPQRPKLFKEPPCLRPLPRPNARPSSCQARPLASPHQIPIKKAQPLEHTNRGSEVPLVDVHDVQAERRRVRRQVVEDIQQDALRDIERAGQRIIALFRRDRRVRVILKKKLVEVLRNVHAQPAQEFKIARLGEWSEAQEDAGFKAVQTLNEPDYVIRVEQDLGGEKLEPRGVFPPDPFGFPEPAWNGD